MPHTTRKTLVVIAGPTGVGKTALSLGLAECFGSPVINADSRQIYRDIPIGTAAPTPAERQRVRHYFVGQLALDSYYSAARYEAEALALLNRLFADHEVLVMAGGSMLYIDAVCRGIDEIPDVDATTRQLMRQRLSSEGLEALADELAHLDPAYHATCDLHNPKRVVHALEICHMTGRPYSSFLTGQTKRRPFDVIKIGLQRERSELFSRIARRVDTMMADGLLEEVRRVTPYRACNALNTVGYKEIFAYLDGEWALDFALEKIKRNTRVYAKKQMTWYARDPDMAWFTPEAEEQIRIFINERLGKPH